MQDDEVAQDEEDHEDVEVLLAVNALRHLLRSPDKLEPAALVVPEFSGLQRLGVE